MARQDEGLKSEALRAALAEALGGKVARLEDLLARHGGVLQPRPNLKLAAAFGAEVATSSAAVVPLLERLGADDAAPDTDRAFLPIAAAHGWAGRLKARKDEEAAWAALAELAGDERPPVRIGTLDALTTFVASSGRSDALVVRALEWLDLDDREQRYGAAATAADVLAHEGVMRAVQRRDRAMEFLSRAIGEVGDAPRSAERSDGRRRLIAALPKAIAAAVAAGLAGEEGPKWLEAECRETVHPHARAVLSDAIQALRGSSYGVHGGIIEALRKALSGSAKPPRDPTRIRPGHGRGKASRRTK